MPTSAPFAHLTIVLVRPQHSGNIGAVARSIANHGLGLLFLVDPQSFDPDRARWMAPHSHHVINSTKIFGSVRDAIADMEFVIGASARKRKWAWPRLSLEDYSQKIREGRPTALLFGPEDSGLSNEDLAFCHAVLTLPTHHHQSLNLSQAVNVFGAHLMAGIPVEEIAEQAQPAVCGALHHQTIDIALDVLDQCSYFAGRNPVQIRNELLRLLDRANVSHQEISRLKGMANKVFHGMRVLRERQSKS